MANIPFQKEGDGGYKNSRNRLSVCDDNQMVCSLVEDHLNKYIRH